MQRRSTETADPKDLETLEQFRARMKREGTANRTDVPRAPAKVSGFNQDL